MRTWCWFITWLLVSPALAADPSVLWNITDGKCVPHMRSSRAMTIERKYHDVSHRGLAAMGRDLVT